MIEHISLSVTSYGKAKKFYVAVLKPLGYKVRYDFSGRAVGFKEGGHTSFWIVKKKSSNKTHIAFLAKSKKMVNDFYTAAMKAGGKDNGVPELQKDYGSGYYAGYVYDLDGNNIEAVYYAKK